jgi:ElaA protein
MADMEVVSECKHFKDLNISELYDILHLRNVVFVLEQNCVFVDTDFKDQQSWHFMLKAGDDLLAYTRLLPEGVSYDGYTSIGRVVSSPAARGKGLGKVLMAKSIEAIEAIFGTKFPIKIGAQLYLEEFYASFGFEKVGTVYDEDGIDHIHMIRQWA